MKRRLTFFLLMILIGLVVFEAFLVSPPLLGHNLETALSVATDVAFLITAIAMVCISFWITFANKETKREERLLLLAILSIGSLFSLYCSLAFVTAVDVSPGWADTNPTVAKNLILRAEILFAVALILAVAAIVVLAQHRRLRMLADNSLS